jgi:hypothetical protein
LAKPYLEHFQQLKFWKHIKQNNIYKIKGMISRFVTSDKAQAKKYCIVMKIPESGNITNILAYCTCKAGARTLGGCAHSVAILYYLTANCGDNTLDKPNTSKKRVTASNVIDLKSFKTQKILERKMESKETLNIGDDVE